MAIEISSLELNIKENSDGAVSSLNKLIGTLHHLRNVIGDDGAGLKGLNNELRALSRVKSIDKITEAMNRASKSTLKFANDLSDRFSFKGFDALDPVIESLDKFETSGNGGTGRAFASVDDSLSGMGAKADEAAGAMGRLDEEFK